MVQFLGVVKTIRTALGVVQLAKTVYDEFFPDEEVPKLLQDKPVRKKSDTTKFTQVHFDFIKMAHADWVQCNKAAKPGHRIPQTKLRDVINENLGMDKSTRALARIWLGEINRDDLPTGKPVTPKGEQP